MIFSITQIITSLVFIIITFATIGVLVYLYLRMPEEPKWQEKNKIISEIESALIKNNDFKKLNDEIVAYDGYKIDLNSMAIPTNSNFINKDLKNEVETNTLKFKNMKNSFETDELILDKVFFSSLSNVSTENKVLANFVSVAKELDVYGLNKIVYIDTNLNIDQNVRFNNLIEFEIPTSMNSLNVKNINIKDNNNTQKFSIKNNQISSTNNIQLFNDKTLMHEFEILGTANHKEMNVNNCFKFGDNNGTICSNVVFTNKEKNTYTDDLNVNQNTNIYSNIDIGDIRLVQEGSNIAMYKTGGEKYIVTLN